MNEPIEHTSKSELERARAIVDAADHQARTEARDARKAASDAIVGDSKDCPDCGNRPHGIQHHLDGAKPFEIGCIHCRDHRARSYSPESARAKWNADEYLPPKTITPPSGDTSGAKLPATA